MYLCIVTYLTHDLGRIGLGNGGLLAKRLMHTAQLSGNISGLSKLSSYWLYYTGFPGDERVTFFNVPPGKKDTVMPNSLIEEESCRVYNCDNECLSVSIKLWIFKSMKSLYFCSIESLKYVQVFFSPVCYFGNISKPLNLTPHKTKRVWLLYLSVKWSLRKVWELCLL